MKIELTLYADTEKDDKVFRVLKALAAADNSCAVLIEAEPEDFDASIPLRPADTEGYEEKAAKGTPLTPSGLTNGMPAAPPPAPEQDDFGPIGHAAALSETPLEYVSHDKVKPGTDVPVLLDFADLDSEGLPWDPRIHPSSKLKLAKTGAWKLVRKMDPDFVKMLQDRTIDEMVANGLAQRDPIEEAAPPPAPEPERPAIDPAKPHNKPDVSTPFDLGQLLGSFGLTLIEQMDEFVKRNSNLPGFAAVAAEERKSPGTCAMLASFARGEFGSA